MDVANDLELDMAYKYPFSREARSVVSKISQNFDSSMLGKGALRLEEALSKGTLKYQKTNMRSIKTEYVLSYLYARMLVSALKNKSAISKYANAEAARCAEALNSDTDDNITRITDELGMKMNQEHGIGIPYAEYLRNEPASPEFSLVHQELDKGFVYTDKYRAIGIIKASIAREISKSLPISIKDLPKEAVEYAKKIRLPKIPTLVKADDGRYAWIARLLQHPIPDVRHRTVNLILAPYLTNIRGMSEEEATKHINAYIQRCKEIDPNTNVNESYIRYQCRYAKNKGSKPLSHSKARELLGSLLDF